MLVGCGPSVAIHEAARTGNIEDVKQHLAGGADVNVQDINCSTSLDWAVVSTAENKTETSDLLRKHGGKTWKELKAEGK